MREEMLRVIQRQWRIYFYAQRHTNVFVAANDFLLRMSPPCRQNLRHIHLGRTVPGYAGYSRQLNAVKNPKDYYAAQTKFLGLVWDSELEYLALVFDVKHFGEEPLVLEAPWLNPFLVLLEMRRKSAATRPFTLDIIFIDRNRTRPDKEMVALIKKLQRIEGIICEWRGKEIVILP